MSEKISSWFAVDVIADPAASEAVESAFNELESLGTEIDSLGKDAGEPICVTGFFDRPADPDVVRSSVEESLRIYGFQANKIVQISFRDVEETDWLAEWKKHWTPQRVGRFTVTPPWAEVLPGESIIITIEPNMAFGTGTHETTQLCLNAISEMYEVGQSFLDVGTGTGVLAIAAAKLGETSILACDTDPDSVTIARENAVANSVADRIKFWVGSIDHRTPEHDFVCANLTLDVILPMIPLLLEKTRKRLLLSGILASQEDEAVAAIQRSGLNNLRVERAGEWIAIIAEHSGSV